MPKVVNPKTGALEELPYTPEGIAQAEAYKEQTGEEAAMVSPEAIIEEEALMEEVIPSYDAGGRVKRIMGYGKGGKVKK